jgi:glyoxylate reductase
VANIGLFDKELIEALPKSLKYICHNGAGYDQSEWAICFGKTPELTP